MKPIKPLLLALAAVPVIASAEPSLTVDRVQQRYPWDGAVDIDYTISGYGAGVDPNDYTVAFSFTTVTNGVPVSKTLANFQTYASCDLPNTAGPHRVTWNGADDGCRGLFSTNVSFTGTLYREATTASEAAYMIVDVSAGPSAAAYPVRYASDAVDASQFNKDLYKTTRIALKRIPAGSFWMGEGVVNASNNRNGNVAPASARRQYVQLTQDYYLAIFETTHSQYYLVCGGSASTAMTPKRNVFCGATVDTAIVNFNNRLSEKATCRGAAVTGFSLPTEAQWERACRAGTLSSVYTGVNINLQTDATAINGALCSCNRSVPQTYRSVGSYDPNPWGFYDMYGNACEWCSDFYGAYPAPPEGMSWDETNPLVNPRGPETGTIHCIRGGCSDSGWNVIISGQRQNFPGTPTSSNHNRNGFRVALTLPGNN